LKKLCKTLEAKKARICIKRIRALRLDAEADFLLSTGLSCINNTVKGETEVKIGLCAKSASRVFGSDGKQADTAQSSDAGPWCSRPNTPPCHGGDRRFESGRARHEKRVTLRGSFFMLCPIGLEPRRCRFALAKM
jgi:hypothetical protein